MSMNRDRGNEVLNWLHFFFLTFLASFKVGSFIYFSEHFFAVGTIKGKYWMVVLMKVSIAGEGRLLEEG